MERGAKMGEMVLDIVDRAIEPLAPKFLRQMFANHPVPLFPVPQSVEHQAELGPLRDHIADLAQQIGPAVSDRHMVDVGYLQSGGPQAICDRVGWKSGPVLDA